MSSMRKNLSSSSSSKRNVYGYMDFAIFQVEDELFKVPCRYFMENSDIFQAMFSSSSASGGLKVEGTDDQAPIRLQGVSKVDFERLLSVIYPIDPLSRQEFDRRVWQSVLTLAQLWEMQTLRQHAVEKLTPVLSRENDAFQKIMMGRQHKVASWLIEGYRDIVKRQQPISLEEAEMIGWADAVRLYQVREASCSRSYYRDPTASLRNIFGDELREVEAFDMAFGANPVNPTSALVVAPNPYWDDSD